MINNFIISSSYAQEAPASNQSQVTLGSFVPLILIFMVFYLLIIRPQNKKLKEHQEMVNNLKINTKVVTTSGIIGVIREIDTKNNQVDIEIAPNITVKMLKSYVAELKDVTEKKDNKKIKN